MLQTWGKVCHEIFVAEKSKTCEMCDVYGVTCFTKKKKKCSIVWKYTDSLRKEVLSEAVSKEGHAGTLKDLSLLVSLEKVQL